MPGQQAASLCEIFADFQPALVDRPLADFSGLRRGAGRYCEVAPRSAEALCQIVRRAGERDIPLRTRAQGHSLNGASLPAAGEIVLSTRNLRRCRFDEPGSVDTGAGAVLWVLQAALARHGFALPVLNDGYAGPSVGGYIASGGFGPGSAAHGGFWHNVVQVRFVDGCGELRQATPGDALFPWLFGSMGQLGIVVEAKLVILPLAARRESAYPRGHSITLPRLANPQVPAELATRGGESLFWFTLFVPDEELARAHGELSALERRNAGALRYSERYSYPIRLRGGVAPLLYPQARPFTATGAWGWLNDSSSQGLAKLRALDRDFMAIATSRQNYRRYIQSEFPSEPALHAQYFDPPVYAAFRELKLRLDPKGLLNRGSVFAPPPGTRTP